MPTPSVRTRRSVRAGLMTRSFLSIVKNSSVKTSSLVRFSFSLKTCLLYEQLPALHWMLFVQTFPCSSSTSRNQGDQSFSYLSAVPSSPRQWLPSCQTPTCSKPSIRDEPSRTVSSLFWLEFLNKPWNVSFSSDWSLETNLLECLLLFCLEFSTFFWLPTHNQAFWLETWDKLSRRRLWRRVVGKLRAGSEDLVL